MMGLKLAIPLLGMLLWVLSIHSGSFATASILNGSPAVPIQSLDAYKESIFSNEYRAMIIKKFTNGRNESVDFALSVVTRWATLEHNLGWSKIHVEKNTPAHGQLIMNFASDDALRQAKDAIVAERASRNLVNVYCEGLKPHRRECAKNLVDVNFDSTYLESVCNEKKHICNAEKTFSKYRTIDGSCNHEAIGYQGQTFTGYKRLLQGSYNDGVYEPRRSITNVPLPCPRLISTRLIRNMEFEDPELTLAFMQWSQFIEHDLAQTAASKMVSSGKTIMCCDERGHALKPRYNHPLCLPIEIPHDDPFYSIHGVSCMNYVRSILSLNSECRFGPIDQKNFVTHYLDASSIYGPTLTKAAKLREFKGGKLRTSDKNLLPKSLHPQDDCQVPSDKSECYRAGDLRVNIQPHLTAMHVIWLREHNRIAESLSMINSHWDDEKLYQETRRIVIAEIQHITYTEWLPVLLGKKISDKLARWEYDCYEDASVSNSFAHAAIRFVNSLVHNKLKIYEESRNSTTVLRLQDNFNNPAVLHKPGYLDGLIRGLATQPTQKMDMDVVSDITQQLYKSGKYGFDALTLDIHRGRDHGLPPYVKYRQLCDLPYVSDFNDLLDTIPAETVEILRTSYNSVEDIDLLVGGIAEKPFEGSLLGPTFTCLIGDQMYRTRAGDRYFYSHKDQTSSFTREQLVEIEKTSIARVFCDNGDNIKTMQPKVFNAISSQNSLVDCKGFLIGKIDLFAWKEAPFTF